jgi:hypothetical protein
MDRLVQQDQIQDLLVLQVQQDQQGQLVQMA